MSNIDVEDIINDEITDCLSDEIFNILRSANIFSSKEVKWFDTFEQFSGFKFEPCEVQSIKLIMVTKSDKIIQERLALIGKEHSLPLNQIRKLLENKIDAYMIFINESDAYVIKMTDLVQTLNQDLKDLMNAIMKFIKFIPSYDIINVTKIDEA